ncbi:glycosyl transferase [Vulcanimicrobium alpinum]|uniref:Glycosyl transferase n=1 Tax=Vulcanimicrobium alpinum TaxID=3016050 RepID=A0AAN2CA77_UNVUL|nr:glycosyltransferase [Vulcanimicrobium alpinum]BDE06791.1 glycosyl transferase [Vulcanimicrobium alpinum]
MSLLIPRNKPTIVTVARARSGRAFYLPIRAKLGVTLTIACLWVTFSVIMALPWIFDLSRTVTFPVAIATITLIAFFPGAMNAFIVSSLMIDRRPARRAPTVYPPVSILIAAYNEQATIAATIENVFETGYPGAMEVLVIDDGSTDATLVRARAMIAKYPALRVIAAPHGGKAAALNRGLELSSHDLLVSIDADTFLYRDALGRIVERFLSDPPETAAVAGTVLVRNSRDGVLAKVQEWDYFHGIAAVKRAQSLYQGTLVAQGAFSLYTKAALREVGGWPDTVGEDIVMTWAMLKSGHRVGYAEDAIAFTNVPTSYGAFFKQRRRWARGLIEAFRRHPEVLIQPRLNAVFIYWNLLFPLLDAVYLFVFVPGVVMALFGRFDLAGPATIAVLPLALLINLVIFRTQQPMFARQGLLVRRNLFGFLSYLLVYSLMLQPATIAGYLSEIIGLRKSWGTK